MTRSVGERRAVKSAATARARKPPKAKPKPRPATPKPRAAIKSRPAAPAARKGLKESLRKGSATAGKTRPEPVKSPEKGAPSPPPPTKLTKGPAHPPPPVAMANSKLKPGQVQAPAKPPRPTMPWPTGTSTAGLRVAAKDGILPPKPLQPPPPPPKRRILDNQPIGKIAATDLSDKGIKVSLEDGRKLLLPFGLVGPEDISKVQIGFDGEGLSLHLRNGETLDYSLVRIQALSEAIEERP